MGNYLFNKGVIGYVTVEFISFIENGKVRIIFLIFNIRYYSGLLI